MPIENKDGYSVSTNPTKLNISSIHNYLSIESYWAKGIPFDVVKKSIDNSLCFGVYKNNQQVGFARVVTDKATFAYLADVFIFPEYRGKGLAKWLMATIHAHPDLQGLLRWLLGTRDAHALYEKFGWTYVTEQISKRFMQLHNPDVYKQP